jgi:hypothetical protein
LGESFGNQRARFATLRDTRRNDVQPVAMYSLRVARLQNVVVVVETKDVDDRASFVLSVAMSKATAEGRQVPRYGGPWRWMNGSSFRQSAGRNASTW